MAIGWTPAVLVIPQECAWSQLRSPSSQTSLPVIWKKGRASKGSPPISSSCRSPLEVGRARWNQATVRGILTNPVYTGTVYLGRSRPVQARQRHSALQPIGRDRGGHRQTSPEEWVAVTQVPAIVSQEQFDRIQAKLAQNQQFASRNNSAYPYLLRALVSCGECQLACTG